MEAEIPQTFGRAIAGPGAAQLAPAQLELLVHPLRRREPSPQLLGQALRAATEALLRFAAYQDLLRVVRRLLKDHPLARSFTQA